MRQVHTLVIGSGAAGLAAALRLRELGVEDLLLLSEGLHRGTSINTGSDKQTYYKLGIYGSEPDSPVQLAHSIYDGGSVHGDVTLVEAALSVRCFMHLVNLGVPFPHDEFGQYIGYKTDHDPKRRATSCGPYTSREMCLALIRAVKAAGVEIAERRTVAELVTVAGRAAGAVAFNGETTRHPVVASLIMECQAPVNIVSADIREIDGKIYGQTILELPADEASAERARAWLKQDGVSFEEV